MQEQRARLSRREKAVIIEMYVGKSKTMQDIADLFDLSVQTVSNTVSLYFKKPKQSKILFSKV
jgi:DNA-binding CsgD family transcriptional regulator